MAFASADPTRARCVSSSPSLTLTAIRTAPATARSETMGVDETLIPARTIEALVSCVRKASTFRCAVTALRNSALADEGGVTMCPLSSMISR